MGAVPARLDRPGGVPLGAVHDPGGPPPGDVRPARPHRRADPAVPGQGDDEARARRRGHPHAVARQRAHRRRGLGGRGEGRLPAHRQADRRRRLGRHLPGRLRRGTRRSAPPAAARARGQRRGVRRRGGVHLRHHLRRRADPVRARALVPAAAAADAHARVGQPGVDLAARPVRPPPGRRAADGRGGARRARLPLRLHAHGVVPQVRRRGRVRRDRGPPARRPRGGPDELRHGRRHVRRLGARRRPRVHAAAGAPVQRGRRSSSAPAAPARSPTPRASTR